MSLTSICKVRQFIDETANINFKNFRILVSNRKQEEEEVRNAPRINVEFSFVFL